MKRTGFKRKLRHEPSVSREDRPRAPLVALENPPNYSGSVSGVALEKENVLKSPAYEKAVRDLGFCVRCWRQCRPQFCHRDEGKGQGIKTDVREGWAGCPECHYFVGTSGKLPKAQRRAEDLRLGRITRDELRRRGTWPKRVPEWTEDPA